MTPTQTDREALGAPASDLSTTDPSATEAVDPRYWRIDQLPVAELAALMNDADRSVPAAVQRALPQIVPGIEATVDRMTRGGRLVYVGAGTPGRIGVLDASECPPTFNSPPSQVFAIMAGGADALVTPREGAEDDEAAGREAIDAAGIGPLDTVVGIASSGRTPFVVAAVQRARSLGALTVGLACNPSTVLAAASEFPIEVVVGPEVISGSTRLKAGTAQKLVLNMFSTIVMVQLGKTYGNLMVDLRATNDKLRERAVRIVATIVDADRDAVVDTVVDSGYDVKLAVLALERGLDRAAARRVLDQNDGRLRAALEATA